MSWNMNHRAEAWPHLHDLVAKHQVAAAMLQEARNPRSLPDGWTSNPPVTDTNDNEAWRLAVPGWYRARSGELKKTLRWYASAVVTPPGIEAVPRIPLSLHKAPDGEFAVCHPGQLAVTDLPLDDGRSLTVISLYGIWDTMLDNKDRRYTEATLHRAISDLTPIFQERSAQLVLVAGDLNLYSYSDGTVWGDRWMTVLSRFAVYGLEICGPFRPDDEPRLDRCPCPDADCRHVNTYLYNADQASKPHQLDFFRLTCAAGDVGRLLGRPRRQLDDPQRPPASVRSVRRLARTSNGDVDDDRRVIAASLE